MITSPFQDEFGQAILCHDAWRTYFHYSGSSYQLCCAPLPGDLNYIVEKYQSTWAENFKAMFRKAISVKKRFLSVLPRMLTRA
jgi:hypothetical protein